MPACNPSTQKREKGRPQTPTVPELQSNILPENKNEQKNVTTIINIDTYKCTYTNTLTSIWFSLATYKTG